MTETNSSFIDYGEFLKRSKQPIAKGAIWKWTDIVSELNLTLQKDASDLGRGAVSLIHKDQNQQTGVTSSLNMLVQQLEPGDHGKPHRHSNFAIFIVRQGQGFSIIDGDKLQWETGDVFFAPAWTKHEHCNTSDTEPALLYTIQNVPAVSDMGALFFQGSDGEDFEHCIT